MSRQENQRKQAYILYNKKKRIGMKFNMSKQKSATIKMTKHHCY